MVQGLGFEVRGLRFERFWEPLGRHFCAQVSSQTLKKTLLGDPWEALLCTGIEPNAQKDASGRPLGGTFVHRYRAKRSKRRFWETLWRHFCAHVSSNTLKKTLLGDPWERLLCTGIEPNAQKNASGSPLGGTFVHRYQAKRSKIRFWETLGGHFCAQVSSQTLRKTLLGNPWETLLSTPLEPNAQKHALGPGFEVRGGRTETNIKIIIKT